MVQNDLESIVKRLEAVASRLESTEGRLVGKSSTTASPTPAASTARSAATAAPSAPATAAAATPASGNALPAYDAILSGPLGTVVDLGNKIGDKVERSCAILDRAFRGERTIIAAIVTCKKPDQATLQQLVGPVGEQMMAASALTEGPKGPCFNHCKCVAEALQALSWVVYTLGSGMNPPEVHVEESWQSGEFWGTKVLKEYKDKDPVHAQWINALKQLFMQLKAHVKEYFMSGPLWNPNGITVAEFLKQGPPAAAAGPSQVASAKPAPRGAPPPPPPGPPPPPDTTSNRGAEKEAAMNGGDLNAVFAQLNKGDAVTSGLRKVTDDMKTKNRTDTPAAVPVPKKAAGTSGAGAAKAPAGPPVLQCDQGRKWKVENQVGNREIILEATMLQTAYIYNCSNSVIQVQGKINAITLDNCSKVGCVFDNVVACVEVVNCKSVELQCTGSVPTIALDKTDGCKLYLGPEALGVDLTTSKCSAINITLTGTDDLVELPVPEQFVSRIKNGHLITEPVTHSGA